MNRRMFGASAAALALQGRRGGGGAAPTGRPPLGRTAGEKRILGVMDQMQTARELYLSLPPENGRMLRLLAESAGAKHVVEVGTSTGYSGLWLCLARQATGGKLTTFELDSTRASQARKHFEQAGVAGLVNVIVGDAHENVKRLKDPIDLVFLDADKEGYRSYLQVLTPLVRPGGLITADNVGMAQDYVDAVSSDSSLDTVFLDRFSVTLKKRLG